jgi:hypothetical protein
MATSETKRDITPFSAGTPTFHDPRGNDHQSITNHFLLSDTREGMRFGQSSDRLTIHVGEAVKLILLLADLPLNPLDAVHHTSVPHDFRDQRLIANLYKGLVNFVMEVVVAAEAEQLLVRIIRGRAVVVIRSGVDVTLVHHSSLVHASPHHGIHAHTNLDPLGCGDTSSIGGWDTERDVVLSAVADEAVWSGG